MTFQERALHILLVEDDEVDILMFRRTLSRLDMKHRLFVARDGREALEVLRDSDQAIRPHIMVIDLNMPRLSGLELLNELRGDPELQNLQVVVMTTSNRDEDKRAAFQHHVAGYIRKPLQPDRFRDMLAAMTRLWQYSEFPQ